MFEESKQIRLLESLIELSLSISRRGNAVVRASAGCERAVCGVECRGNMSRGEQGDGRVIGRVVLDKKKSGEILYDDGMDGER